MEKTAKIVFSPSRNENVLLKDPLNALASPGKKLLLEPLPPSVGKRKELHQHPHQHQGQLSGTASTGGSPGTLGSRPRSGRVITQPHAKKKE